MKATRRHELKENVLAQELVKLKAGQIDPRPGKDSLYALFILFHVTAPCSYVLR